MMRPGQPIVPQVDGFIGEDCGAAYGAAADFCDEGLFIERKRTEKGSHVLARILSRPRQLRACQKKRTVGQEM
jgi:hypothetical protein